MPKAACYTGIMQRKRTIMKKIILVTGILGATCVQVCSLAQQNDEDFQRNLRDRLVNDRAHRSWRDIFGAKDWDSATEEQKNTMMREAFKNHRAHLGLVKLHEFFRVFTKPQTVVALSATALGAFAAWHATSLAKDLAKHYLLIPPLCTETSIHGWGSSVKSFFVYEDVLMPSRDQVVFNQILQNRFEKLSYAITNVAKNDVNFRHCLFYGPPGTGKTMVAKAIAKEAGLEYMYFSAANLEQYPLEEGIKQIIHLFEYAKAFPKKLMIIMDEADSIFAHRDSSSDKTRTLLNKILTYTGTEQNNYVVIAITNRPQDFDEAALSRFGVKIKVGAPGLAERKRIFAQYAHTYFIESHTVNRDQRSLFQWIFSRKPVDRTSLVVEDDVFTDDTFDLLAEKSKGLGGREIADIIAHVQHDAYGTADHLVTKEMLFEALEEKLHERETIKDFRQAKPTADI
jgi:ATPase family AAA domain-containing protein 3A/B